MPDGYAFHTTIHGAYYASLGVTISVIMKIASIFSNKHTNQAIEPKDEACIVRLHCIEFIFNSSLTDQLFHEIT